MAKIRVEVNGVAQEVAEETTLEEYLEAAGMANPSGMAVAVNGRVIRRRDWDITTLADGDQIMLLTAAQGG